jgi:hypothetical protein
LDEESSVEHYPALLKYAQQYSRNNNELVYILRNRIRWQKCSNEIKKKLFQLIDKSFKRDNLKIMDFWIKTIAEVNSKEDLKYLDFIILLAIADTNTETQLKTVKKVVTDQIEKGLFTKGFLKRVFTFFSFIINDYAQTFLELLDALKKGKESLQIYDFMANCYKMLFKYCVEPKQIIGSLVNFLSEKRPQLPWAPASKFKIFVLDIFHDVKNNSIKSAATILKHYKILLRVLDLWKVELTFNEHRSFMKLLTELVYKVNFKSAFKDMELQIIHENRDALRDHLHMIVTKQINIPDNRIRHLGFISAVKIISSLVADNDQGMEDFNSEASFSFDSIPKGPLKEAAELLNLILSAAEESAELLTIIYDELSHEFQPQGSSRNVNSIFIYWLSEKLLTNLESLVIVEKSNELLEASQELNFEYLFEIVNDQIEPYPTAINLGSLALKDDQKDILILPSLLKATQALIVQRYGELDMMAGMMAMSIILPKNFNVNDDKLSDNVDVAKIQLDLYFHACNWLREIVSGFVQTSKDAIIRKLVKQRFKQLIKLEEQLNRLLMSAPPGYCPPFLNFAHNAEQMKSFVSIKKYKEKAVKPPPNKKARKSKGSNMNETENDIHDDESSLVENKDEIVGNIKSSNYCREMRNDVTLLLKEKFELNAVQHDDKFALKELIYLLELIFDKFSAIFKGSTKGFVNEMVAIEDLNSSIIPHLVSIFRKINTELRNLTQSVMETDTENDDDERLFYTPESEMLKKGFGIILKMFTMIFSCKKLKHDDNEEIFNKILKSMLFNDAERMSSPQLLCSAVLDQFMDLERIVKDINGAVALIDFITTINSFYNDEINSIKIIEIAERFLKRIWKNSKRQVETGSEINVNLEKFLKIYVKKAKTFVDLKKLIDEMKEITTRNQLIKNRTFPCITKTNLIYMLRVYLKRLSDIITSSKSNQMDFEFWKSCCDIEEDFIDVVKFVKSANVFKIFLKNILIFLRRFNVEGMKILSEIAKENKEKFILLVKGVQGIRRSAHGAANELKHRSSISASSIMPLIRYQLEIFYQAASTIAKQANFPTEFFSSGVLKNFDIQGDDIFSQNTTVVTQDDESSSENEMSTNADEDENQVSDDDEVDISVRQTSFQSRSTIL